MFTASCHSQVTNNNDSSQLFSSKLKASIFYKCQYHREAGLTKPFMMDTKSSGCQHFPYLGLEQHHYDFVHGEVEETASGMCHKGTVARTNDAVPGRPIHFIELLFG
jgi:hypothetical protein